MAEMVSQVLRSAARAVWELFAVVFGRCSHMTEHYCWCRDWKPGYYDVVIEIAVGVAGV